MKLIRDFVSAGGEVSLKHNYLCVSYNSDKIMRIPLDYAFAEQGSSEYEIVEYYLKILINLNKKSPQEIAAEEVVEKAASALKAAKDVLKAVKEK
jgi:hypothetical protein